MLLPMARFDLPSNWSPEGTMCVVFTIPDDQQYLSQIIGLVDLLKWSRNFQRDETGTGAAIVSRTWQEALEQSPVRAGGCSVGVLLTVNDDCQLLYEADCTDGPRPVQTGGTQYDPRQDNTVVPGWTTVPEGQDGACLSAANATEYFKYTTDKISALWDTEPLLGVVIALALGLYLQIVAVAQAVFFGTAFEIMVTIAPGLIRAEWLAFDWDTLRCKLFEIFASDGTVSDAAYAEMVAWLEARWGDSGIYKLISIGWLFVGTPPGAGLVARWAGITEYDCSGCGWSHTWNAANGWSGWQPLGGDAQYGVLSGGAWDSVDTGGYTQLVLESPHLATDTNLTRIIYRYTVTGVGGIPFGQHRINLEFSGGTTYNVEVVDWSPGTQELDASSGYSQMWMYFDIEAPSGYITVELTEVVFYGDGTDPY